MRVAAQNIKPGDRIRGIGLTVIYAEPQDDFRTRLEGTVSVRSEDGTAPYDTALVLPNEHLVNVVRSDEAFRADRIELVQAALNRFDSAGFEADADALIAELTRVGNMPRHAAVHPANVAAIVGNFDGSETAEAVLDQIDTIETGDFYAPDEAAIDKALYSGEALASWVAENDDTATVVTHESPIEG